MPDVDHFSRSCCNGQRDTGPTSNYLYLIAHRIQITLTDDQFEYLDGEADRSSVSIAELIRRAVDTTYGISSFRTVSFISHTLGRRAGRPLDA
jgi:hypothetical protein